MHDNSVPTADRLDYEPENFKRFDKPPDPRRRDIDGNIVTFRKEFEMMLAKNKSGKDVVKKLRKKKPR